MLHQVTNMSGLVAQRITRLTTDQKIAGSNPAEVDKVFCPVRLLAIFCFRGGGKAPHFQVQQVSRG